MPRITISGRLEVKCGGDAAFDQGGRGNAVAGEDVAQRVRVRLDLGPRPLRARSSGQSRPWRRASRAAGGHSQDDRAGAQRVEEEAMTSTTLRIATAREYRRYAQSCRDLAARSPSEEERKGLLRLAEAWEQLSNETDRQPALSASKRKGRQRGQYSLSVN
jgi:hypothetical protein